MNRILTKNEERAKFVISQFEEITDSAPYTEVVKMIENIPIVQAAGAFMFILLIMILLAIRILSTR